MVKCQIVRILRMWVQMLGNLCLNQMHLYSIHAADSLKKKVQYEYQ